MKIDGVAQSGTRVPQRHAWKRHFKRHADYLLEAHHFGELSFRQHLEYMVISPTGLSDLKLRPQIVANANKFTRRNGIRLFQTD